MQKPSFQKNRLSLGNWLKLILCYSFFLVVHTNLSFAQTEDAPPQGIRWKLISEKQQPLRIDTIRNLSSLYLKDPKTYLPATSLFSWPSMDSLLPQKTLQRRTSQRDRTGSRLYQTNLRSGAFRQHNLQLPYREVHQLASNCALR